MFIISHEVLWVHGQVCVLRVPNGTRNTHHVEVYCQSCPHSGIIRVGALTNERGKAKY